MEVHQPHAAGGVVLVILTLLLMLVTSTTRRFHENTHIYAVCWSLLFTATLIALTGQLPANECRICTCEKCKVICTSKGLTFTSREFYNHQNNSLFTYEFASKFQEPSFFIKTFRSPAPLAPNFFNFLILMVPPTGCRSLPGLPAARMHSGNFLLLPKATEEEAFWSS